jgi:hypothetical protein
MMLHRFPAIAALCVCIALPMGSVRAAEPSDLDIALGLSKLLQSARAVISTEQDRINNAEMGDKGLTGDAVLERGIAIYKQTTGSDPRAIDANSRYGKLLAAEMTAIREVMTEAQSSINKQGVGFKGFVPAVFGRLVTEHFQQIAGRDAEIKVTAPPELVRNRKARPDDWEVAAIRDRLNTSGWERGKVYSAEAKKGARDAFRVAVPEYYTQGCLSCHGVPKGELDITGYPKEGGKLDDLGGVISVTLYR